MIAIVFPRAGCPCCNKVVAPLSLKLRLLGSIDATKIGEQFIERDLFNATKLDQIQWKMEGTGFTKEKLVQMLTSNKSKIEALGVNKISDLLSNKAIKDMTIDRAADLLINHFSNTTNYLNVFK